MCFYCKFLDQTKLAGRIATAMAANTAMYKFTEEPMRKLTSAEVFRLQSRRHAERVASKIYIFSIHQFSYAKPANSDGLSSMIAIRYG